MMRRLLLLLTAVMIVGSCSACFGRALLESLFGPPTVAMQEAYASDSGTAQVDHTVFDSVLRTAVVAEGYVDYTKLATVTEQLDQYLETLARADFAELSRDRKLATLINAYNAFTLRLILDHMPLASIRDITSGKRWEDNRWVLGGMSLSLMEIENHYLRARFQDPRIHFAINCASISCPPLRGEAFVGDRIEAQLRDQALIVHKSSRWFVFDEAADEVSLTALYRWYSTDFLQVEDSLLRYAARFSKALEKRLTREGKPDLLWLDYDWSLNHPK